MTDSSIRRRIARALVLAATLAGGAGVAQAQTPPPAWDQAPYFKAQIENILVASAGTGAWNVRVVFSIVNPTTGTPWNLKADLPYTSAGASVSMLFGWAPDTDFSNTGSASAALTPTSTTALGSGAALPVSVRNLHGASGVANACASTADCPGVPSLTGRFWVQRTVMPVTFKTAVATGRIGLEGRAVCNGLPGCPTSIAPFANIPVRSATADFALTSSTTPVPALIPDVRRKVVDFDTKCSKCHNGIRLDGHGVPIPRLSLHGNNRNENPNLCVMCHNPNQTDVPYRLLTADPVTSAAEVSVDFKRMVHGIHAGEFRTQPLIVVGFGTSIHDYRDVRFPAKLRDCTRCHVDNGRKGSFELPLPSTTPGTTIATGSVYALPSGATRTIDVNPFDDRRITPTAATCSGCHDKGEVRTHMVRTGGASFSALQSDIGTRVVERCANCHGPGKDKDVRRAHEIRSASTSRDDD